MVSFLLDQFFYTTSWDSTEARRYLTIPNAAGNEALPEPNMLDAAA